MQIFPTILFTKCFNVINLLAFVKFMELKCMKLEHLKLVCRRKFILILSKLKPAYVNNDQFNNHKSPILNSYNIHSRITTPLIVDWGVAPIVNWGVVPIVN